jgi:serine/threonine-protein kinase
VESSEEDVAVATRSEDVRAIFESAVEIEPASDRAAYLGRRCAGDAELRLQVESLLAAHDRAGDFLARPAAEPTGPPLPADLSVLAALDGSLGPVSRVHLRDPETEAVTPVNRPGSAQMPAADPAGQLHLLGEIARGGMGAVLKGRDTDLGRDVAVKVLLEGHRGKPDLARRFLEEAQIAGQLQHPGITPVYALGQFADGRPYFTMKLVKGQTLAALLAARKDRAEERPRYLGIFAQVCQTLAYAHARGVIHRDLKPSNVMVGGFGEVQVMDWGLAKVLTTGGVADEQPAASRERERPEEMTAIRTVRGDGGTPEGSDTQAGTLLGTPGYMAPEQARGDVDLIDERADVFGLGAILCEILTGQPPFTGRHAEAARRAQQAKLDDAFARLDGCGADGELVALARRCLAAEPWDRPRHAGEVAEQVTAYQEAVAERLRQAELARAAEEARAAEARATAAQERKAREAAQARALAERRARRLTLALAASVLLTAAAGGGFWWWLRTEREARLGHLQEQVNAALGQATAFRDQARGKTAKEALALAGRAREQAQRAQALVEGGPPDEDLAARVRALVAELDDDDRDRRFLTELDKAQEDQTVRTPHENRFAMERALPHFRTAFRTYGVPVGEGDPAAVAARFAGRSPVVREAAVAALDEWIRLAENPRLHAAEPHRTWLRQARRAIRWDDWDRRVEAAGQERPALKKLAAKANVGRLPPWALLHFARRLEAVGAPDSALALMRRAHEQYPDSFWINEDLGNTLTGQPEAIVYFTAAVALRPESAGARYNLGNSLRLQGKLAEAAGAYRQALALDPRYASAHANLASVLQAQGNLAGARAEYRKAVHLEPNDISFHMSLGLVLRDLGRLDEAEEEERKAIKLANDEEPRLARTDPRLPWLKATPRGHLAQVLLDQYNRSKDRKKLDEAFQEFKEAVRLRPNDSEFHSGLGTSLAALGDARGAAAEYRKALQLDPNKANAHVNFGALLLHQGQLDEAIAECRWAVASDPRCMAAWANLATALERKGILKEAAEAQRKAVDLDPNRAQAHNRLGYLLWLQGKTRQAVGEFHRALALDPNLAEAHHNLATVLAVQGKVPEAEKEFRKALALDPKFARPHAGLGDSLRLRGRMKEAIAEYQKALALHPNLALAHRGLGNAHMMNGAAAEAVREFRRAIALAPRDPLAHVYLGVALLAGQGMLALDPSQVDVAEKELRRALALDSNCCEAHVALGQLLMVSRGKFAEARDHCRRALELLSNDNPMRPVAENDLRTAEGWLELERKLPDVLAGKRHPGGAAYCVRYAQLCLGRKLYTGAARLFAQGLPAEPRFANDLVGAYRYRAACAAALAAAGQGEDAGKLREPERAPGCGRTWLPTANCSTPAVGRLGPSWSSNCRPGGRTLFLPVSASRRPCRNFRPTSGRRAGSCGPTWQRSCRRPRRR